MGRLAGFYLLLLLINTDTEMLVANSMIFLSIPHCSIRLLIKELDNQVINKCDLASKR